jgi:type IV pilus assembly protein PilE
MATTIKAIKASQGARISFLGSRGGIGTRRRCHGFKLVEFVAVLVIASTLGISAVSASYGSSGESRQGPRATAQTALADIAVQQEQYFLSNKRYTGDLGAKGLGLETTMTPGDHYALRVELPANACPAGYCYILTAVPQAAQADDECGTLTLTSDGAKLPAACW